MFTADIISATLVLNQQGATELMSSRGRREEEEEEEEKTKKKPQQNKPFQRKFKINEQQNRRQMRRFEFVFKSLRNRTCFIVCSAQFGAFPA